MNLHQLYPGAIVKVAAAHEVEKLTEEGWGVVDVREENQQESGFFYTEEAFNPTQQYSCRETLNKQSPSRVTTRLVFILIKGKDTVVEESRKIAENYKQKAIDMLAKLEACEKQIDKLKKELDFEKGSKEYQVKELAATRDKLTSCEQTKRKLEEHIAKLRQEIGGQRFREIIGEENKA